MMSFEYKNGDAILLTDDPFKGLFLRWTHNGTDIMVKSKSGKGVADLFFGDDDIPNDEWIVHVNKNSYNPNIDISSFLMRIIVDTPNFHKYYETIRFINEEFRNTHLYTVLRTEKPTLPFYGYFNTAILNGYDDIVINRIRFRIIEIAEYSINDDEFTTLSEDIERLTNSNLSVEIYENFVCNRFDKSVLF